MKYGDVLPDAWLPMAKQSNTAYIDNTMHIKRRTRTNPHIRICLDREDLCPAKRHGGCIASHCILRYPTEHHYTQLR